MMEPEHYQHLIPHVCPLQTLQEHIDHLGLCWSISSGLMEQKIGRGVEGPGPCHWCDISVSAKRWDKKRDELIFDKARLK